MNKLNKKITLTLLLLLASGVILLSSIVELGFEKLDSSMGEAVAVFATAKLLNGIISMIQGSGIDFGVVLSLGQILDPINDLVEFFSNVMLLAIISIGIQKILLQIVGYEFTIYTIVAIFCLSAVVLWQSNERYDGVKSFLLKLSFTLFALYIVIPALSLTSVLIEKHILAQHSNLNIEQLNKKLKADERSWQELNLDESKRSWYEFDIKKSYNEYKNKISNLSEDTSRNIEQMMIVFIFKTIIFPLIFLVFIYILYKKITQLV
ncbi:MAG: hypothetical protein ACLFQJ_08560 [Campylobacterales bacterium]